MAAELYAPMACAKRPRSFKRFSRGGEHACPLCQKCSGVEQSCSILDRTAGRAFKKYLGSTAFSGCVDRREFCLSPPSAEILRRKTKARFGGQIGLNLFC